MTLSGFAVEPPDEELSLPIAELSEAGGEAAGTSVKNGNCSAEEAVVLASPAEHPQRLIATPPFTTTRPITS